MKIKIGFLVALLAALVACGKKDATSSVAKGPAGACMTKDHICLEYYGKADRKWVVESNCTPMGVPVLDKCPLEKAVARCVSFGGTFQEMHSLYYDAKSADFYCKQDGVVRKAP